MQISNRPGAGRQITKRLQSKPQEESTLGLGRLYDGLPRWPQAAVRGIGTYAPASIGAAIGGQYGLVGRLAGAAVGTAASYTFQTAVAGVYDRQAKVTAAVSGVFAALSGGPGLSLAGVGMSLGFSAGMGCIQELATPR